MMHDAQVRSRKIRRTVAVAVAGATLGVGGALAMAQAQDDTEPTSCGPTAADLTRAALAARQLEEQRPDLYAESDHPATYGDLRLAAEWASRMEALHPDERC